MTISVGDDILRVIPNNIPTSLKGERRWVGWKAEPKKGKPGELTKVPYKSFAPFQKADKTNESHWSDYQTALEAWSNPANRFAGLGFVAGKKLVGIDLDNCVSKESGELSTVAADWVKRLGSYAEKTPSGTGVRILVRDDDGVVTKSLNKRKLNAEIYTDRSYITITGQRLDGVSDEVNDGGGELRAFYDWLERQGQEREKNSPATKKDATDRQPAQPAKKPGIKTLGDDEILALARKAKNATKFNAIWAGDQSGYESASEADLALASMLAFYAGPHGHDQVERLMRQSALQREKYDRGDYLPRTVRSAIAKQGQKFYSPPTWEANLRLPSTCTDLGFARRIVSASNGMSRWCVPEKTWYGHDGQRFVSDNAAAITNTAKAIADDVWREWKTLRRDRQADAMAFAQRWSSTGGIEAAIRSARSEKGVAIYPDDFDADPLVLNVENGTLDLRTGKLRQHSPDDLITHLATVSYDPTARADVWRRFIQEVMAGDSELIQFLQQVAGLAITGDVREQCLCIHYGSGRNGKSTFLTTLSEMLGSYAGPGPTNMLVSKGPFGQEAELLFEALAGKRFVTGSELDDGAKLSEATAKLLTGGDRVLARRRYQDSRPVAPTWHLHIAVNHRPHVVGRDEGIWGRVKLVPWSVTFDGSRQDPDLGRKLALERAGILNWCLEGLADWRANGLITPRRVRAETARYRDDFDLLGAWIADRCNVGPDCVETSAKLYEDFCVWASSRNEPALTNTFFGMQMRELVQHSFCKSPVRA